MKVFFSGHFQWKISLVSLMVLLCLSPVYSQEKQGEFFPDVALVQCSTTLFQDLEKITQILENKYKIRVLAKMSPHFLTAIIPDDLVSTIRTETPQVENIFKKALTDNDRKGIPYKDKDSRFVLGYWEYFMDRKLKIERGEPVEDHNHAERSPLINDDMPGTKEENELEYHRQRARKDYPRLSDEVLKARSGEISAVMSTMDQFWQSWSSGSIEETLSLFSRSVDPNEMIKVERRLEREKNELQSDKGKRAALKDFSYYIFSIEKEKAKVVIFQEQGLPSSEITFIRENDDSWKIIDLS